MKLRFFSPKWVLSILAMVLSVDGWALGDSLLLVMRSELNRNFETLAQQAVPAYYIDYRLHRTEQFTLTSSNGALISLSEQPLQGFYTQIRIGSPALDNTHERKQSYHSSGEQTSTFPFTSEFDELIWRDYFWKTTNVAYNEALQTYGQVDSERRISVDPEDSSPDFSPALCESFYEPALTLVEAGFDSTLFFRYSDLTKSVLRSNRDLVSLVVQCQAVLRRSYFVSSEGTEVVQNHPIYTVVYNGVVMAEDGMFLSLNRLYRVTKASDLPSLDSVRFDLNRMSERLSALKSAPIAESYSGPALLAPQASAVFFHEFFGHRVEGARMKSESDAQTFKKKVGEKVLPDDLSVVFDPTADRLMDFPMIGSYRYDEEGVRAERVEVVRNGVLSDFLMTRKPIEGFPRSNGHARGTMRNNSSVSRQSNMLISSDRPKSTAELRRMLLDELVRQNKPYGYLFEDVSGGFTMTSRFSPNAFNVEPLLVYRIYTDGRADELVRGVTLIGTPLNVFSQIVAAGDRYETFNGVCGAESGGVNVSAVAPMLLLRQVETQKQPKNSVRPFILTRP